MWNGWYIAADAGALKQKPLARQILGQPLVLFRDQSGQAATFSDCCPHRNAPLSLGKVSQGRLRCPYHGWEFDGGGHCVYVPSLCQGEAIPSGAQAKTWPTVEQDGYIWVWMGQRDPHPDETPFRLPYRDDASWTHTRFEGMIPNALDNVIENFIDCPHTGYVHGGWFRSPASHLARTRVQARPDGVEIEIDEETTTNSFLSRLLVSRGHKVTHQDRFILPSIVQVAYNFGPGRQVIGFQLCTPVTEFQTLVYVYLTWRFGWWARYLRPLVPLLGRRIFFQDLWILAKQAEVIQQQGRNFTSVPADTANLWIQVARARAARGEPPPSERDKEVDFRL